MFTQCPECETYFRVAAADLEAADGRVRCSKCDAVFDARAHLVAAEAEPALGEGAVAAPVQDPRVGDLFGGTTPARDFLDGSGRAVAVEPQSDAALDAAIAADDEGLAAYDKPPEAPPELVLELPAGALPPLPMAGRPRATLRDRAWAAIAAVLGLSLAAQLVHAYREPLALDPRVGPLVARTYARLDMPIEPPRDLARIGVQRTEVTTHPLYEHVLMLSGVIVNEASFPQPLPVLRVRLEDRWGELVGYRLLEPKEYLRRTPARGARFEPGQSLAIALEIVDPGSEAVGYAIEPCLRVGASLACHGDPGTR